MRVQIDNIVRSLVDQPQSYRHFGVYWWRVKRTLLANGAQRVLPWLSGEIHTIPEVEALDVDVFWSEAFAEAHRNGVTQYLSNEVWTRDGARYIIRDQDAEF